MRPLLYGSGASSIADRLPTAVPHPILIDRTRAIRLFRGAHGALSVRIDTPSWYPQMQAIRPGGLCHGTKRDCYFSCKFPT